MCIRDRGRSQEHDDDGEAPHVERPLAHNGTEGVLGDQDDVLHDTTPACLRYVSSSVAARIGCTVPISRFAATIALSSDCLADASHRRICLLYTSDAADE